MRCDNPRCARLVDERDKSTWLDVIDVNFIDLDREISLSCCQACCAVLSRTGRFVDGKPFIYTEAELLVRRGGVMPCVS